MVSLLNQVPYFYGESELALHPPVFRTKSWEVPVGRYRKSPRSKTDFASFFWNVGLPLYFHDDAHMLLYEGKRVLGLLPQPATNSLQKRRYVG